MIESLVAILCGLLLLAHLFPGDTAMGRVVSSLAPFETVVGVVALVLGVLNVTSVLGLLLLLAGLVLAVSALKTIPRVGDALARAGTTLDRFRVVLGVIVLIAGVVALLGALTAGPPAGRGPPGGPPGR
jgi:hypothetical protein